MISLKWATFQAETISNLQTAQTNVPWFNQSEKYTSCPTWDPATTTNYSSWFSDYHLEGPSEPPKVDFVIIMGVIKSLITEQNWWLTNHQVQVAKQNLYNNIRQSFGGSANICQPLINHNNYYTVTAVFLQVRHGFSASFCYISPWPNVPRLVRHLWLGTSRSWHFFTSKSCGTWVESK